MKEEEPKAQEPVADVAECLSLHRQLLGLDKRAACLTTLSVGSIQVLASWFWFWVTLGRAQGLFPLLSGITSGKLGDHMETGLATWKASTLCATLSGPPWLAE